jgi:predicted component of type VI protein secretion system
MSWYNKVAWSEGLFLRPQLFQQQERYLEHLAHKRTASLSPFYWGFNHYSIDAESLSLGKLVLASAAGIFSDGTPFDAPGQTLPPAPLTILPEHLEQVIHLAVPIRTPNGEETTFDDAMAPRRRSRASRFSTSSCATQIPSAKARRRCSSRACACACCRNASSRMPGSAFRSPR